jgi:hypothetical protein
MNRANAINTGFDFQSEIIRRARRQQILQSKLDVDELNCRVNAVASGEDRFYTEAEAKLILEHLERHG